MPRGIGSLLERPLRLAGLARQARRGWRHVASRLRRPSLGVVFHPAYAPPDSAIADSGRAAKILDHLLSEGWLSPKDVIVPPPIDLSALRRVHGDAYLESLDDPQIVARNLGGVETLSAPVAAGYLSSERWATAGTVHAASLAVERSQLVVNLGGGFHHAERARGGGFCLFHDIAVALEQVRARGFRGRVLVIDLDLHQGDGTRRVFADDPAVVAASVHAAEWDAEPLPGAIDIALGAGVGDETYLEAVRDLLARAFFAIAADLVFYVAGVDVAIDDTLGSWRVSADAIAERDRLVIERCRGLPTVMVLGGGYGGDAWRHTTRTLVWLLSGEDHPIPPRHDRELSQFRRIARSIGADRLTGHQAEADGFGITEADVLGELVEKRPKDQLLGFYTLYGVELAFERYGVFELARRRGYPRVRVELNVRSGSGEAVTLRTDDARRLVLIELIVRGTHEIVPYQLLSIEWLLLQDPQQQPTPERPLLPGQQHPGLGGLRVVMGMLTMAAERLGFDGLTFLPAEYHVAAQARGTLKFLEPRDEAVFVAIRQAVGARTLFDTSRLVDQGALVDELTGKPFSWKPARMILPVSAALREALEDPQYDRRVEEAARGLRLRLAGAPSEAGQPTA